ncbi:MAG: M28 family peptidase [Bacteroidetes bacterium]|nr:M28 family peptidase [Bacteroidota bacterium]
MLYILDNRHHMSVRVDMHRFAFIVFLCLPALTFATAQQRMLTPPVRKAMERFSADSLWRHAAVLADDRMEGRGTGSAGERRAAAYLAGELERLGLQPAGPDGSFLQPFPLHGSRPLPASRLTLSTATREIELRLGNDYLLFKTGAQTFIPLPLRLVFVGYGIVAPEYDYNDYQYIDVTDAIVVFLSGEPESADGDFFAGRRRTVYSIPEMKQRIAFSRGARGSILLPLPRVDASYDWEDWRQIFAFEDVSSPITVPSHLSALMRLEAAAMLFDNSVFSLEDVLRMDAEHRIRSFPLRTRLRFSGEFRERDFLSANVAGLLPGSDPLLRDSYVLVSAHYDHLGIGPAVRGDSIYNGLVDNALGCAALLEMARILSDPALRPRRSLLFLFVAAEEKGLLGSQYYCTRPLVPLHKTIANLNVDGLAIIDVFDDVVGIGSEFSTIDRHLHTLAGELAKTVSTLPEDFDLLEAFAGSDQIAFAQAGVPSLLVMEGTAYRNVGPEDGYAQFLAWGRERYHTPFDDPGQPVNHEALRQHGALLCAFLAGLANTYEPPQWIPGSKYVNARLQSLAEER